MNEPTTKPTTTPVTGRRSDLLTAMVGLPVEVILTTGATWRGELREVGTYELTMRRTDGRTAVLHKAAVVAGVPVLPAPRG
jgi:hypothetical protein